MTKQSPRRIVELDALRGLAALSVLVFHYTVILHRYFPDAAEPPFRFAYGYYGVDLFFMISGFVIFMTLQNCKTGRDFVVSRFARLYPPFWTAVLLTSALGVLFPLEGQYYSVSQFLVNLTMLQGYVKVSSIDGVYWSLTYELGFYFVMFVIYRLRLLDRIEWFCLGWATGSLLFRYYAPYIPHPVHFLTLLNSYAHLFAMGIVFYRIHSQGISALRVLVVVVGLAAEFSQNGLLGFCIVGGFVAVFGLLVVDRLKVLRLPVLIYFGTISYSLYLTHQLIGFRIIQALQSEGVPGTVSLVLAGGLIISLASVITFGIERPAMRAIRNRYRRSRFFVPARTAG